MYYYYVAEKLGDGKTIRTRIRPNIPSSVVCSCAELPNSYLVGTEDILDLPLVTDLESFCEENNLIYEDILKWLVGEG